MHLLFSFEILMHLITIVNGQYILLNISTAQISILLLFVGLIRRKPYLFKKYWCHQVVMHCHSKCKSINFLLNYPLDLQFIKLKAKPFQSLASTSHGQINVAISRVRNSNELNIMTKVLLENRCLAESNYTEIL